MLNKFYLLGIFLLISCGKNEPLNQVGKIAEGFGQLPRKMGKTLLGIKEKKEKETSENSQLESEVERLNAEIETLIGAIEELRMLIGEYEVNQDALEVMIQDYENRLEHLEKKLKKCRGKGKKSCKR